MADSSRRDTAHNCNYKSLLQWYRMKNINIHLISWVDLTFEWPIFLPNQILLEISLDNWGWLIAAAHFDFVIRLKNLVNPSARPLWCPTKSSVFFQIALSKQTLNLYPKMQHKRQFPSNVKVFPFLPGYWVKRCNCNSAKWAKFFGVFFRGSWFSP